MRLPVLFTLLAVTGAVRPVKLKLTPAQIRDYRRDGVIVVKGLLSGRELRKAQATANRMVDSGNNFAPQYNFVGFQGWRTDKTLRGVAFDSAAPRIAAELMGLDGERPMRVLKDALLALSPGDEGCGWHVDDKGFWPCHDDSDLDALDEGVNVWITLSPLKASEGGGLAVAPGSSCASWSEKCRAVIENKPGERPLTCRLAELSPEYNSRLDAMKALHDMEPGDAIFHSRYCFHKGEQFGEGETKLPQPSRRQPTERSSRRRRGGRASRRRVRSTPAPQ